MEMLPFLPTLPDVANGLSTLFFGQPILPGARAFGQLEFVRQIRMLVLLGQISLVIALLMMTLLILVIILSLCFKLMTSQKSESYCMEDYTDGREGYNTEKYRFGRRSSLIGRDKPSSFDQVDDLRDHDDHAYAHVEPILVEDEVHHVHSTDSLINNQKGKKNIMKSLFPCCYSRDEDAEIADSSNGRSISSDHSKAHQPRDDLGGLPANSISTLDISERSLVPVIPPRCPAPGNERLHLHMFPELIEVVDTPSTSSNSSSDHLDGHYMKPRTVRHRASVREREAVYATIAHTTDRINFDLVSIVESEPRPTPPPRGLP